MSMMRKVLLTGATGFIGRALTDELLSAGFEVTALGRRAPVERCGAALRFESADLSLGGLDQKLETIPPHDIIVHLAATPKLAQADAAAMTQLHVRASASLASLAAGWGARFLHVSTAFVGAGADGHLCEGPAQSGFEANEYERTKTLAEFAVLQACPHRVEILRPAIVMSSPQDSPGELLQSPVAAFLRVASSQSRELPFAPPNGARLAVCRRADVVEFIRARLFVETGNEPRFWNMLAPESPLLAEAFAISSYTPGSQRRRNLFAPWIPYLEGKRSWDIDGYLGEAERLGLPVRPASVLELHELAEAICATLHPNREATVHAGIA
jgi:nucleoside-diphosphate-sugar epimerase